MRNKITLKKIGEGVKHSIENNQGMLLDGVYVIRSIEHKLYFDLEFLKKYGNIVRVVLRDEVWKRRKDGV